MNNIQRTALSAALASAMGVSTTHADIINTTYNGWFTMINPAGDAALNNGDTDQATWYGWRTPITGTMTFDADAGTGTGSMDGFSFFGSGLATVTNINLQAIGDGVGGPGTLVLGNMGLDWGGSNNIPISTVWDASGLYSAIVGGLTTSDVITGGVYPATENFQFYFGKNSYTLPYGPSPLATTTWNTTDIGTVSMGDNPSGTLPLTDDGIGGSPMKTGPFPGFNANFDIMEFHVDSIITTVPIPATVWLFGTGLLGLAGIARRKKA